MDIDRRVSFPPPPGLVGRATPRPPPSRPRHHNRQSESANFWHSGTFYFRRRGQGWRCRLLAITVFVPTTMFRDSTTFFDICYGYTGYASMPLSLSIPHTLLSPRLPSTHTHTPPISHTLLSLRLSVTHTTHTLSLYFTHSALPHTLPHSPTLSPTLAFAHTLAFSLTLSCTLFLSHLLSHTPSLPPP